MISNQLKDFLAQAMKKKIVIVGIGNTFRSDDGLGVVLIEHLIKRGFRHCVNAGTTPENYVSVIARYSPEIVLLIDAVHLNQQPGTAHIFQSQAIASSGMTTHDCSIQPFITYLASQSKASIYLLGIQPKTVAFGEGLSEVVTQTIEALLGMFTKVLETSIAN